MTRTERRLGGKVNVVMMNRLYSTEKRVDTLHVGLVAVLLTLSVSCSPSNNVTNTNCYVRVDSDVLFLGSVECLSQRPAEKIEGYWVVGFEYSVFYRTLADAKANKIPSGYWMSFFGDLQDDVANYSRSGSLKIYKVSFIGSISDEKGFYADGLEELLGGVLVRKNFEISDVRGLPEKVIHPTGLGSGI